MKLLRRFFPNGTRPERRIRGSGIAPGIGFGKAYHLDEHHKSIHEVRTIQPSAIDREMDRIQRAIDEVKNDLDEMSADIEDRFDVHTAGIFRAQSALLSDPSLRERLKKELRESLVNAEEIVQRGFAQMEERLRSSKSDSIAARGDDVADLARRVILRLGGIRSSSRPKIPPGSVVIAEQVYPSDTAVFPKNSVEALVVTNGSPGSHVALLAKEMGIPVVAGIANPTAEAPAEANLVVDGTYGVVYIAPSDRTMHRLRRRIAQGHKVRLRERWLRRRPVTTQDGHKIEVHANVGSLDDAIHATQYGAAGIGLFRLEKLYLSESRLPSEDDLVERLSVAIRPFSGKPINIRLLDVGGDKRLPYLEFPEEENPFLGRRGVRLLFHFPELLRSELRALLRVHTEIPIRILVPMVTFAEDMNRVREVVDDVARELGVQTPPPLGSMIETPAAALCAGDIARVSDFLSIGTNDLTQYTMAADRDNPLVSEYFRTRHAAVYSLIRTVVEKALDKPVSVCGDLAGDLDALPELFETGITNISVAPPLIAHVKDRIRGLRST